jgi:hypothetical protein
MNTGEWAINPLSLRLHTTVRGENCHSMRLFRWTGLLAVVSGAASAVALLLHSSR